MHRGRVYLNFISFNQFAARRFMAVFTPRIPLFSDPALTPICQHIAPLQRRCPGGGQFFSQNIKIFEVSLMRVLVFKCDPALTLNQCICTALMGQNWGLEIQIWKLNMMKRTCSMHQSSPNFYAGELIPQLLILKSWLSWSLIIDGVKNGSLKIATARAWEKLKDLFLLIYFFFPNKQRNNY